MGVKSKQQRKLSYLSRHLVSKVSPPKITEALRRYGVSDGSTALLVIRINPLQPSKVSSRMSAAVEGTQVPLSELGGLTDWVAVKKVGESMRVFGLHSF
jgi:hypothetical protein